MSDGQSLTVLKFLTDVRLMETEVIKRDEL